MRQAVAVADVVEDNAREVESNQSAQQRRHREQEQIHQVAAVGADERPHAHDQAEDVARTQLPRVGERDLAGSRGRGDCRFSVQIESQSSDSIVCGRPGVSKIITARGAAGKGTSLMVTSRLERKGDTMPALIFEKRNHVAYLTMNRPEVHNSLNPEMLVSLAAAWKEIDGDDAIRATIVTGAGKVAFSAGADLGKLIPLFTGARKPEDEWDRKLLAERKLGDIALLRGYDMDKPVISAVNGFCIAGGMEFIQGTDLRVAADDASFGLQEVKWAIIPAAGSLARLQRQIPYCKAMEILLTGNRIDAQEAWRLGLVNYVVPQEQLMAKAEELAATIAQNGQLAVRKIKEAVRRTSGRPYEEAFKIENEIAREVMKSEDAKEGPRSFMEKRKPNYKGR